MKTQTTAFLVTDYASLGDKCIQNDAPLMLAALVGATQGVLCATAALFLTAARAAATESLCLRTLDPSQPPLSRSKLCVKKLLGGAFQSARSGANVLALRRLKRTDMAFPITKIIMAYSSSPLRGTRDQPAFIFQGYLPQLYEIVDNLNKKSKTRTY